VPLQNRIETAAALVYGQEQAPAVCKEINRIIQQVRQSRPIELLREDFQRPADWYKEEIVYMFYPERFGTQNGQPNTFKDLIPKLDYLNGLGVTTLYLLPFLESPMIDAGFDVSDYKQVRKALGGNEAFDAFIAETRKRGFKIKADLVLNHVSDQHPWFQAALQGDPEKLDYFLIKHHPPKFHLISAKKGKKTAVYHEEDGQKSKRRIIFPEISDNHYRREVVDGQVKHFYHTFYPHQIDLNWQNPNVLYEALDIMGYWANKGIDIFRLDAIQFLVKQPGTHGEGSAETHAVIQLLSASLQAMSPRSVLWAEACQSPKELLPYFGEEAQYSLPIQGHGDKAMTRSDKVQIAYHFPMMPALWASMVTQKPDSFWKIINNTPKLPPSTEWSNFLRVHDELTLEAFSDPKIRKTMIETLMPKGEPFRGGEGVGGRLADFLDHDPKRIGLSYSILYSLPGMPLLYYGDEIGETNDRDFMLKEEQERKANAAKGGASANSFLDARDIGRAPVALEKLVNATRNPETHAGQIYHHVRNLIQLRKQEKTLVKGSLSKVKSDQGSMFSYLREYGESRLLIAHNLSGEESVSRLQLPAHIKVSQIPDSGLINLQTDKPVTFKTHPRKNQLEIALAPYQSMWLKLSPDQTSD